MAVSDITNYANLQVRFKNILTQFSKDFAIFYFVCLSNSLRYMIGGQKL